MLWFIYVQTKFYRTSQSFPMKRSKFSCPYDFAISGLEHQRNLQSSDSGLVGVPAVLAFMLLLAFLLLLRSCCCRHPFVRKQKKHWSVSYRISYFLLYFVFLLFVSLHFVHSREFYCLASMRNILFLASKWSDFRFLFVRLASEPKMSWAVEHPSMHAVANLFWILSMR